MVPPPGWPLNWAKRIKITNQYTFHENETNFTFCLVISAASGTTNQDLTVIFDELMYDSVTSYPNRKKIALCIGETITQCSIEIESWDDTTQVAVLWCEIPIIISGDSSDLFFYLYYDVLQADNTTYVKDKGSGQTAWTGYNDGAYKLPFIYHMSEDFSDSVYLLTESGNIEWISSLRDLVTYNIDSTNSVTGLCGRALDFNGVNEYAEGNPSSRAELFIRYPFTIEVAFKMSNAVGNHIAVAMGDGAQSPPVLFGIGISDGKVASFSQNGGPLYITTNADSTLYSDGAWHHLTVVFKNSTERLLYADGIYVNTGTDNVSDQPTVDFYISIARWPNLNLNYFDGIIDEARIILTPYVD